MTASGLTQVKASSVRMALLITMAPFMSPLLTRRSRIQALAAAEEIAEDADRYEPVTCVMCQPVHLVNPWTGKVLGEDHE